MELRKGYKQTETGVIPEDWSVKPISFALSIKHGKDQKAVKSEDGIYPILGTGGIMGHSTTPIYSKESVLIGRKGTIDKPVYMDIPFWTVDTLFYSEVNEDYNAKFLYYKFLLIDWYAHNEASGVPSLNARTIEKIEISLPPTKAEQTAIATALSDMDNLIDGLEKLIAKKKAIKQGAMQELLRPKEGWVEKRLGDSADISRGGSPRPIERYLTNAPDGINWIKIGDVEKFAKYIENTEEKIIPEGISRSRFVNEGDFLLSNSMSFGRPYILKTNGCIHDGWLVIQNYKEHFNRDFLYYVLGSESVLVQYRAMASGSSVLNLNKEIVKNVLINCTESLEEQAEIATVLSDMDNEIMLLESNLEKHKLLKQGMMQELLTGKTRLA